MQLLIILVLFATPVFSTETIEKQSETIELTLKPIELTKPMSIEFSTPALNTVSMDLISESVGRIEVEDLRDEITTENDSISTTQSSVVPNPTQDWPKLEPAPSRLPLFLLTQSEDKKEWHVPIFGTNEQPPHSLSAEIDALQAKQKSRFLKLEGPIVKKLLDSAGIAREHTLFYRSFSNQVNKSVPIENIQTLWVEFWSEQPPASILSISIPLPADGEVPSSFAGAAWVGAENPFTDEPMQEVRFEPHKSLLSDRTLDEILEFESQGYNPPLKSDDHVFSAFAMSKGLLVESKTEYKVAEDYKEQMLAYLYKRDGELTKIYDFYLTGTYNNRPEKIFSGKWLKNFSNVLVFGSVGMGDCGKFVLIQEDGSAIELPIRCATGGC